MPGLLDPSIVFLNRVKMRTWSCYVKDENSDRPHPLSLDFLKKLPYNEELIRLLPENGKVNMAVAGPLAMRINLTKMGCWEPRLP